MARFFVRPVPGCFDAGFQEKTGVGPINAYYNNNTELAKSALTPPGNKIIFLFRNAWRLRTGWMTIDKKEIETRIDHFENVCRDAGLKLTHQRQEIFREVAQTHDHPDAENVFRRIRKRLPTVSLDTVYRTLWLLNDLGLIHTFGSHHARARFDANLNRHHHFVCISCGLMEDFYSAEFDSLTIPDSLQSVDTVKEMQVEVRGICNACAAKNKLNRKIKQEESV